MKKRLTIYLPESILFKVKFLALQKGVSVSQLMESVLSEYTKEVQLPPKNKK